MQKNKDLINYLVTSVGVGTSQIITILTMPIIAAVVGAEVFGAFNYLIAVSIILVVIMSFKSDVSVFLIRKLNASFLFSLVIFFNFTCLLLVFFITFFLARYMFSGYEALYIFLLIFSTISYELSIQINVLRSEFERNAISRFIKAVLFPLLFIIFYYSLSPFSLVMILVLSFSFSNLISSFYSSSKFLTCNKLFYQLRNLAVLNKPETRDVILSTAFIQIPAHLLKQLSLFLVVIYLGTFVADSASNIGYLAFALKVTIAPIAIIVTAVSEVFKNAFINEPTKILNKYASLSVFLITFSIFWSGFLYAFSEPLIVKYMGEQWRVSYYYIIAIIPYMSVLVVMSPITYAYMFCGKQKHDLVWQFLNFTAGVLVLALTHEKEILNSVRTYYYVSAISIFLSGLYCVYLIRGRVLR